MAKTKENATERNVAKATKKRTIDWDSSNMKTTFANVVNIQSTQEQIDLFFGTNQTWNAAENAVKIELSNRIILTPHAAKRLWTALGGVLEEYEARHASLTLEGPATRQ